MMGWMGWMAWMGRMDTKSGERYFFFGKGYVASFLCWLVGPRLFRFANSHLNQVTERFLKLRDPQNPRSQPVFLQAPYGAKSHDQLMVYNGKPY